MQRPYKCPRWEFEVRMKLNLWLLHTVSLGFFTPLGGFVGAGIDAIPKKY